MKGTHIMTLEIQNRNYRRHPMLAVLFSIAATGLGHIYCGKLAKGLTLFFLSFAFAPIIVGTVDNGASTQTFLLMGGGLLMMFGVFTYAIVDAYRIAGRTPAGYTPREYNRWYIYCIFILVSVTYPANISGAIRDHVVQAYKIPSASMIPTILKGDYVFLNKAAYRDAAPKVGDVVVFVNPNARHRHFIKRIIAMPGDTVAIRKSELLINGRPLERERVPAGRLGVAAKQVTGAVWEETNRKARYRIQVDETALSDFSEITVPNGHCFVLGDNREKSSDSRDFGPVPLADIRGKVDFIYLPAAGWQRFGSLVY